MAMTAAERKRRWPASHVGGPNRRNKAPSSAVRGGKTLEERARDEAMVPAPPAAAPVVDPAQPPPPASVPAPVTQVPVPGDPANAADGLGAYGSGVEPFDYSQEAAPGPRNVTPSLPAPPAPDSRQGAIQAALAGAVQQVTQGPNPLRIHREGGQQVPGGIAERRRTLGVRGRHGSTAPSDQRAVLEQRGNKEAQLAEATEKRVAAGQELLGQRMWEQSAPAGARSVQQRLSKPGALREVTPGMADALRQINIAREKEGRGLLGTTAEDLAGDHLSIGPNGLSPSEYSMLMKARRADLGSAGGQANVLGPLVGRASSVGEGVRHIGDKQHAAAVRENLARLIEGGLLERQKARQDKKDIAMARRQGASPLEAILETGGTLTPQQESMLEREQLRDQHGAAVGALAARIQGDTAMSAQAADVASAGDPRAVLGRSLDAAVAAYANAETPEERTAAQRNITAITEQMHRVGGGGAGGGVNQSAPNVGGLAPGAPPSGNAYESKVNTEVNSAGDYETAVAALGPNPTEEQREMWGQAMRNSQWREKFEEEYGITNRPRQGGGSSRLPFVGGGNPGAF